MNNRFESWVIDNSRAIMAISFLIVLFSLLGFQHVKLIGDYKVFFEKDDPSLLAFESLEDTYSKTDQILIVMSPKSGDIFTKEFFQAVVDVTDKAWLLPYATRVDSMSNFQYTQAEEDDLIVADLIEDPNAFDAEAFDNIKNILAKEPLLMNRLVDDKGKAAAISVTIHFPTEKNKVNSTFFERLKMTFSFTPDPEATQDNPQQKVMKAARKMLADMGERYPAIEFRKTGTVVMNMAFTESSIKDATTLIPASFLIIILGMFAFIRSFFATIAALCVVFASIFIAMGGAAWYGLAFSPPVVQAPLIILTLAVADSLHLLTTFFHEMRLGKSKNEAITESLRLNFMPVFLTSITTAIGFMTLNFSDSPPFHHLGNVVAFGVMAAFFFSIFLLPAMLSVLPIRKKTKESFESRMMESLGQFVVNNSRKLFYISGSIILICISFLPQNELNDIWSKYFDKSLAARQDTEYTRLHLTGVNTLQFSVTSKGEGGINAPEYLHSLEKLTKWLRGRSEVMHVQTHTDTIKRLNKDMHAGNWDKYVVPDDRELAAQYLLLYEMSLPQGLDLNNQINFDKSATRLIVTVDELSTAQMIDFEKEIRQWMADNTPLFTGVRGSSSDLMFAEMGQRNIVSMLEGTAVALVIISFILLFALKSIKFGLISFIPNIVPAAMGFGIWGLVNGQVGLGLSVVAGMTLGIVVDDTVHFLSKYLRARREKGMNRPDAVMYSFRTVGVALVATTIILCFGFGVLAFSAFKLNSTMGLLTSITIALALIVDFLFLPPLLLQFDRSKRKHNHEITST